MKIRKLFVLFVILSFFGCEDYLDVVPENDIATIESIFMKRKTALEFFNGCYLAYNVEGSVLNDPAVAGCDEYTTGEFLRNSTYSSYMHIESFKICQGLQNPSDVIKPLWDISSYTYIAIRNCNTFIKHIDDVYNMSQEEKDEYKAGAKAIKAYNYFKLLRCYGPIVLLPTNINVQEDVETMQVKRSPVDTCINRIVKLIDEAIPHVKPFSQQPKGQYGLLNREALYAIKAKTLLYAASPLFNGNSWYAEFKNKNGEDLFSFSYDPQKWERAAKAIDEAIDYCHSQGKILDNSYFKETSKKLNVIRNLQYCVIPTGYKSPELIYGFYSLNGLDISLKLPRFSKDDPNHSNMASGTLNPGINMVELFYTDKGLPINMDKTWDYENRYKDGVENDNIYKNVVALNKPVVNLHLRREPRFYADIAGDGCIWLRDGKYYEMAAHRGERFGCDEMIINPKDQVNITGYWCKKMVHDKNYIDKRSYIVDPMGPYPAIRLADLYLMQAEAYNEMGIEYKDKVYAALNLIRDRAGVPDIEEAWESYSKNPAKIKTQDGLRDVIRQERMIELAFEGHRFWDLRRWKIAHEYLTEPSRGWNILGDTRDAFYNNHKGPIVVYKDNKFETPRDYFWPIRDEEVLKANVVQNLGW